MGKEDGKPPMGVLNMNAQKASIGESKWEDEAGVKIGRKQAPAPTQEENIRRALRDYYANKK